jgi:uncharacterized Zn finger protein
MVKTEREAVEVAWPSAGPIADQFLQWIRDDERILSRYRVDIRRGRILARKGAVRRVEILPGRLAAEVASDSGEVHAVSIRMDPIEKREWDRIVAAIAADAELAADILHGRLSGRIQALFDDAIPGLFAFDDQECRAFCTCQAGGDICMGIIAVAQHFAEVMQADPMKLLHYRGREWEALKKELRDRRGGGVVQQPAEAAGHDPLFGTASSLQDGFWEGGPLPEMSFDIGPDPLWSESGRFAGAVALGGGRADPAAPSGGTLPVLRSLPVAPLNTRPEDVVAALEPIVRAVRLRLAATLERQELAEVEGAMVTLPPRSAADGAGVEEVPAALDPALAESPDDTAHAAPAPSGQGPSREDLAEAIIAAAGTRGELTVPYVAKALGVTQKAAREHLDALVSEGRLLVDGKGRALRFSPAS